MSYVTYSAKRDIVGSGTNIVSHSENFANSAYWFKTGLGAVNSDTAVSPDGTTTADKFIEDTTSNFHCITRSLTTLGNSLAYTLSVYAKADERSWARLRWTTKGNSTVGVWFNVSSGTIGTTDTGIVASISNIGSSWYRIMATISNIGSGTTATPQIMISVTTSNGVGAYTGTASSGMHFWGAMVNAGASAAALPRVEGRTYSMSFDLQAATRETDFQRFRQFAIGGNSETLFQRREVSHRVQTGPLTESETAQWREFLASVAGNETYVLDIYGSVGSADNARNCILDSSEFSEDRIGPNRVYTITFTSKETA